MKFWLNDLLGRKRYYYVTIVYMTSEGQPGLMNGVWSFRKAPNAEDLNMEKAHAMVSVGKEFKVSVNQLCITNIIRVDNPYLKK